MAKNLGLVSIIDENENITTYKVKDVFENSLEHEKGILFLDQAKRYFDNRNGTIHYFYNLDDVAKMESANLKTLRRSVALQNIFKVKTKDKINIMQMLPYLIIALMILFK